nr:hypothetical protein CPGR_00544 [Mycolicibacterium malmesburyense]
MSQPVSRLIKLAIGHRAVFTTHRHRPRYARHLHGEQLRNRPRHRHRLVQHRPVGPPIQAHTLGLIDHINRRKPPCRIGGHRIQHPPQPLDQRLDTHRIEHIGAKLHRPTDPGRLTGSTPAFSKRKRQIHSRGTGVHRQRLDLHITQHQPVGGTVVPGEVLPRQQHLHQRMMSQTASRIEPLHQHLKRHVLMLISGQTALLNLGQQLTHSQIRTQINPQHQRVDEKTHQLIKRRITTTRDRKTESHITAGTDPRQQHRQRRLHHHETGRTMLTSQQSNPRLQLSRPIHHHTGTAIISNQRIRPISGQRQPLRHPRQSPLPKPQLPSNRTIGIGQLPQMLTLPQRVIHILQRQLGPLRRPPPTPRLISHPHISGQHTQRPTISGNMVNHHHQHMLITSNREKPRTQRNLSSQIKRMTRRRIHRIRQPPSRPTRSINNLKPHPRPLNRHHHLPRHPINSRKHRAQTLMTTHHIAQSRTQRPNIKTPTQPQRHRHVVNR